MKQFSTETYASKPTITAQDMCVGMAQRDLELEAILRRSHILHELLSEEEPLSECSVAPAPPVEASQVGDAVCCIFSQKGTS